MIQYNSDRMGCNTAVQILLVCFPSSNSLKILEAI